MRIVTTRKIREFLNSNPTLEDAEKLYVQISKVEPLSTEAKEFSNEYIKLVNYINNLKKALFIGSGGKDDGNA